MKRNPNVVPRHTKTSNGRPTKSWDAIDEQMEREGQAVKGGMQSAGRLKTVNNTADPVNLDRLLSR